MPLSKVIHRNYSSMNSVLDVVFTDIDTDVAENLFTTIWQLAARYERILSCFDPQSEVYLLNEKAFTGYFPVSTVLFEILKECKHYHQLTQGYFDIGLRNLKSTPGLIPAPEERFGAEAIEIDEESRAVRIWSEHTAIDLGGIGKGILLREIDKVLTEYSIPNCFISFGGSSILTRGTHPHGSRWPVSLRSNNESDYTFYLHHHAASISESHPEARSHPHIFHPRKLNIAEKRLSFVQAGDPALAEVISTTLIIAPVEDLPGIVKNANVEKAIVFEKTDNRGLKVIYSQGCSVS